MGKRSQTWNKPLSRRMLEKQLNELAGLSVNKPVEKVTVEIVFGFDDPNALVVEFDGADMKNNLFGFLMDKSLTSRIIDIYGCGMFDVMKIMIIIQTFSRALRKTNIDSRTMECFDKLRMK